MQYKELEGIGLTKSEILVYTSLLKIGQSPTGRIVKEAKISSGKIYEILEKLIAKGLVGYILKNKVKHFSALSPDKLKDYITKRKQEIEEKEKEVEKIIPELKELGERKEDYSTEIFMGFNGIRNIVIDSANSMTKTSEYISMGVSGIRTKASDVMWEQFSAIAAKKGVKGRIIASDVSEESLERLKEYKKKIWKGFNFRTLEGFNLAPIMMIDNKTYIINWENPSVIVITSDTIAKQFVSFFDSLWKIAKKV